MFFLFGWGHRTTKDQGPTLHVQCPNCHNKNWFQLLSYRTWFTFFFVPVIPYENKSLLLCPVCSRGWELEGEQVEKAKKLNGLTKALLAQEMPEAEYASAASEIKLLQ